MWRKKPDSSQSPTEVSFSPVWEAPGRVLQVAELRTDGDGGKTSNYAGEKWAIARPPRAFAQHSAPFVAKNCPDMHGAQNRNH